MKKRKINHNLCAEIIDFLELNEVCFRRFDNESLPEIMMIIQGKVTWIELDKNKQLINFSKDMIDNGCVYLVIHNIDQFKRTFISYVISERMEEKINE